MKHDRENRYYHGGLGESNWRDYDSDIRDGDFGREYQDRYRNNDHPQDYRNRRDFDANRFRNYRTRDYDMENEYYENTRGDYHSLGDIRQGYGFPSFSGSSSEGEYSMNRMQRERRAQQEQGYGSGRLSGYSGAAFGGANYSSHGDFGGAPEYGSMSGGGGNVDDYVSSSGYGGGYQPSSVHTERRGAPDYRRQNQAHWGARHPDAEGYRYGNRTDRGGYSNYDPNF
ncbi:MAG: hypothetical protein LPK03_07715 [Pontibacter sp.]|nr:hypothetical protein [Pontibacter sp.]